MNKKTDQAPNGFSLVELSVVLIILGLLAGGITAGNSLVKASRLQSVVKDVAEYKTALNSFQTQYDALPGDMTNAHDFWDDGADGVCGNANQCNGNGNNIINWGGGPNSSEAFRSWQHLSLAGLVSGNYTGVAGSGNNNKVAIGENAPASRVQGGGYALYYWTAWGESGLNFGKEYTTTNSAPVLNPKDTYSIDKKMDDGLPDTGRMTAIDGSGATAGDCRSTSAPFTYSISKDNVACRIFFKLVPIN